ncbi:HD-like signal output (HDOD) protein [Natronocella acetinitrilica]|uniref:HD-like signal output (HDOD) protein n=1 Tax=Natronocella acetinitrilica TaxID=414046 RepID=A0AAE3G4K1_9GAMM|nr:HDOD domain-containing protein [Natronocella acetinitrilica]MCP1674954.1 HD-like signal output (HDOD) protein [Natronocella acetinitrilica]
MTKPARRLEDWIQRLAALTLPILTSSRNALAQLSETEDTGVRELARIAYGDAALAINLIHAANQLRHRHLDTRIVAIEQAIMMLGVQRTLEMAGDYASVDEKLQEPARRGYLLACSLAYHAAWHARDWAEARQDILPAEIATAALVRSVGELAMWCAAPRAMTTARELGGQRPHLYQQAQYVVLGVGLADISAGLIRQWRLPLLVLEHLVPDKVTGRRTLGLALAANLAQLAPLGWRHPEFEDLLETVGAFLGLDADHTQTHVQHVASEAERYRPAGLPLTWKPLLPDQQDTAASSVGGREFCMMPRPGIARSLLSLCARGDDSRTLDDLHLKHATVEAMDVPLSLALRALHHGYGLSRAIFLRLDRRGDYCRPYMALGCEGDPHLPDLELSSLPGTQIHAFLHAPQAQWLDGSALQAWRAELPLRGRRLFCGESALVGPVRDVNGLCGLIYADRTSTECALNERVLSGFNATVQALETGLRRIRIPVDG